jgi:hypothetical protein
MIIKWLPYSLMEVEIRNVAEAIANLNRTEHGASKPVVKATITFKFPESGFISAIVSFFKKIMLLPVSGLVLFSSFSPFFKILCCR